MQFADRKILRISVTDLKERLGIADKYKLYSGLKRDVINPAVEEINNAENTRIRLKISEIKHGRAVAVIEFKITVINKVRRLGNFVLTRGQARMMARRMLDLPNKDSFYKKVYQTVPGASLNGCEDRSQEVAKYEQELQKPEFAKALSEWLCAAGYEHSRFCNSHSLLSSTCRTSVIVG
jgi:plasmid replication initiation protein